MVARVQLHQLAHHSDGMDDRLDVAAVLFKHIPQGREVENIAFNERNHRLYLVEVIGPHIAAVPQYDLASLPRQEQSAPRSDVPVSSGNQNGHDRTPANRSRTVEMTSR
jgi:hypothetical protein